MEPKCNFYLLLGQKANFSSLKKLYLVKNLSNLCEFLPYICEQPGKNF